MSGITTKERLRELLENGMDVKFALELAEPMLEAEQECPENMLEIFTIFYEYGLPGDEIEWWIFCHFSSDLCEDIVKREPEAWEEIGVRAYTFFDTWIQLNNT